MRGTIAKADMARINRTATEIQIRKGCSDANCGKYQGVVSYKGGQWSEQLIGSKFGAGFTALAGKIPRQFDQSC
jgi:hypothetical protein